MGSPFSLPLVKLIVNSSRGIEGALSTGMITQYKCSNTLYHFTHDNIKEAALSLVPQNDNISLYMGIKLLTLLSEEELDRQIFTVANLLLGANRLSYSDSSKVVELFIQAGERALSLTAFENAFQYFEAGLNLLGANCWDNNNYDLTLKLYNNAAKSAFGMQKDAIMNKIIDVVLINATSPIHLTDIYSLKIMRFNEKMQFKDAIGAVMFILNELGEKIDQSMYNHATSTSAIERVKRLLSRKSEEEIVNTKKSGNAIDAILSMFCHLFLAKDQDPNLYVHASIRMIELSLKQGLSKDSCIGEKSNPCLNFIC